MLQGIKMFLSQVNLDCADSALQRSSGKDIFLNFAESSKKREKKFYFHFIFSLIDENINEHILTTTFIIR